MKTHFLLRQSFLFLYLLSCLPAQSQQPVFTKINLPEGSREQTFMMAQDQQGFIWIATIRGLHRYNGYQFVSYYHEPHDSHSLASDGFFSLLVSKSGVIWVGTLDRGLDRFDPL